MVLKSFCFKNHFNGYEYGYKEYLFNLNGKSYDYVYQIPPSLREKGKQHSFNLKDFCYFIKSIYAF